MIVNVGSQVDSNQDKLNAYHRVGNEAKNQKIKIYLKQLFL